MNINDVNVDMLNEGCGYVNFKASLGGVQIGLLQTGRPSHLDRCNVLAVDVTEHHQRKGVGALLYRHLKKYLEDIGCYTVTACVEGSGTVQLHERTFGPGNTKYMLGDHELCYEDAVHHMDVDFGRLRLESKLYP